MSSLHKYNYHKYYKLVLPKQAFYGKGLSGVVNMGNMCYQSSIIQCLSHTPQLTDYFLSQMYLKDDLDNLSKNRGEYRLIKSYINLLKNLWDYNQVLKPRTFVNTCQTLFPKYTVSTQQDAHEYLIDMLECFHKALSYNIQVDIDGTATNDSERLMKKSIEYWKTIYSNGFSFINQLFNGTLHNIITCVHCNESLDVFEAYNCLSVDILNTNTDILQCIESTFQSNIIKNWTCEKCNKSGCTKKTDIWSLPNHLIIHLKRFDQNGKKKNTLVNFPINDLDLTKMISTSKNDPNNYIYSLYAVNLHQGQAQYGHYWSVCKNLNDTWYLFDDGNVSKCHNISDIQSHDAYILFYYRKFIT